MRHDAVLLSVEILVLQFCIDRMVSPVLQYESGTMVLHKTCLGMGYDDRQQCQLPAQYRLPLVSKVKIVFLAVPYLRNPRYALQQTSNRTSS